jgi:hypothetical protein
MGMLRSEQIFVLRNFQKVKRKETLFHEITDENLLNLQRHIYIQKREVKKINLIQVKKALTKAYSGSYVKKNKPKRILIPARENCQVTYNGRPIDLHWIFAEKI